MTVSRGRAARLGRRALQGIEDQLDSWEKGAQPKGCATGAGGTPPLHKTKGSSGEVNSPLHLARRRKEGSHEWLCHEGAMRSRLMYALALSVLLAGSQNQSAGQARQKAAGLPLEKLELHNVKAEPATYLGRGVVRITDAG
jgi:hypothetical protein